MDESILEVFLAFNAGMHSMTAWISAQTGLTLSELMAVEHLRVHGPITAKEISQRMNMGSSGTTTMLDRLEKRGLIRRMPHPTDRRSIIIQPITRPSEFDPYFEGLQNMLLERIYHLSQEQKATVLNFFTDVNKDVERAITQMSDRPNKAFNRRTQ